MIKNNFNLFRKYTTSVSSSYYVSTPIFYVNAAPHIGHLYSAVIADACTRFQRLVRDDSPQIALSTGTDEHGIKVQQAASSYGAPVADYCNKISGTYLRLFQETNIGYTDYVRTTEARHKTAVHKMWDILKSREFIYSTKYTGWYCVSDETFLTDSQLHEVNGRKVSIESGHPVEWTEEENYMFKLSKMQDDVIKWAEEKSDRIMPQKFYKILLHLLQMEPLPDISVSRPKSRVNWAIDVPNDPTQTIYVWLDALVNYLTCAGFPDNQTKFAQLWPNDLHVIGKDILKFHAIYWPAFLMAADMEPPHKLLVHSHWTVDGQKMSKSKHNVVDPLERAQLYTAEGLRFFLLREGVAHSDGNYSDTKVLRVLNSELADTLGNLLSRGCAKTLNPRQVVPALNKHEFKTFAGECDAASRLLDCVRELPDKCRLHYSNYNFHSVVDDIMATLHAANNFFEQTKPWELRKQADAHDKLTTILRMTFETLRICGIMLQPIVPMMSTHLLDKLNVDATARSWRHAEMIPWNHDYCILERNLAGNSAVIFRRIVAEKTAKMAV